MADGNGSSEPTVRYTVREMFDRIDGKLDSIDSRVAALEQAHTTEVSVNVQSGKTARRREMRLDRRAALTIAIMGVLVNLPTVWATLHHS